MKTYDDENTIDLDVDTVDTETPDDIQFEELDWVGDEKKDKQKLRDLRTQLKQSQTESREHLTALQRSRADYVNLKKELDEIRTVTKQKTIQSMVEDILPVLDSFDMAMGNTAAWEAVDKNWRTGIEYIYSQLKNTLESYGVSPIDTAGVRFDPNIHEPMETITTDIESQDDMVQKIVQKGYQSNDRVIRPAKVVVYSFGK